MVELYFESGIQTWSASDIVEIWKRNQIEPYIFIHQSLLYKRYHMHYIFIDVYPETIACNSIS